MATRKRPKSQKHDLPVEGRKKDTGEGIVSPKYNTDHKMKWDEEGESLHSDRSYGSGNDTEKPIEESDDTDPRPNNFRDDNERAFPADR